MPLLGYDFNPARPTDGDFVRHPTGPQAASEIRDLKSRILGFFSVKFLTDAGDLKTNSVPTSALVPLSPSPRGTFRKVTVNGKGQVTGGDPDRDPMFPRALRAVYFGASSSTSFLDDEDGVNEVVGKPSTSGGSSNFQPPYDPLVTTAQFSFLEYTFVVPEGVTKVDVRMSGKTPNSGTLGAVQRIGSVRVSGGDVLRVFVGADSVSPCRVMTLDGSVYFDNTSVQSGVDTVHKGVYEPWFDGVPSVVVLEWYA